MEKFGFPLISSSVFNDSFLKFMFSRPDVHLYILFISLM